MAFALAITDKYAKYFASQGCKYYNIGADEYANDLSSMGFENMGSALYTKVWLPVHEQCSRTSSSAMV